MNFERSSGLLLHITSLPSPFGIGDLGRSAYKFVDFLEKAGQKYWQILPLNPTEFHFGNSPYSSPSAFAGNILLISPEGLLRDGYLKKNDLKNDFAFRDERVEFEEVIGYKKLLLERAWQNFRNNRKNHKEFVKFCKTSKSWLEDYALYVSLKANFDNKSWVDWPEELRDRQSKAIEMAKTDFEETIEREQFFQFIFFNQWQQLVDYSHEKGIRLIGDIPFYVSHDSADCWANTNYFKLDAEKQPVAISGVPPDYFSETGQLWGTPVYDWEALQQNNFHWWVERVKQNLLLFDVVRFDHFRALSAFWEVPAGDETAVGGKWTKTPGRAFFQLIRKLYPAMPFIAEDLGSLDEPVHELRDEFELPGMKVLLFAFGDDMANNPYILHNHIANNIVYTGTHDNNTVKGWYMAATPEEKKRLSAYLGQRVTIANVAESLQRLALMSVADLAIIPMQDVLSLGEEAIMNRPGTSEDNWTWRLVPGKLTKALALKLRSLNALYGR